MAITLPEGVIPDPLPWRTAAAPARPAYVPPPSSSEGAEAPRGKFGRLLAAKKQENVQAAAAPSPASVPAPGGGKMLAFLQKKREALQIEGPLPEVLEKIAAELRAQGRAKGFPDFATILHAKRERLEREMEKHEKAGALTDPARDAFRKEIAETERLLQIPPAEAVKADLLLKGLAAFVKQGTAGLSKEITGLMDELS